MSSHLKRMKERQYFGNTLAPPTQQQQQGPAMPLESSGEDTLKQRNLLLQGRVRVLQEHNRRLEGCISQLKLIAEMVCAPTIYVATF